MLSTIQADKGHFCIQWVKQIFSHLSQPLFALTEWCPREGEETGTGNLQGSNFFFHVQHTVFYYVSVLRLLGTKVTVKNQDNPQRYAPHAEGETRGGYQRPSATCRSQVSPLLRSPCNLGLRHDPPCASYAINTLHLLYTHVRTRVFLKGKTQIRPPKPQIT